MDRFTAVINQEITLVFNFFKLGAPYDAYSVDKVEIYKDYNDAISNTNIQQVIDGSDISRIDVGKYEYRLSPIALSGTYFDKIYLVPDNGQPQINIVSTFYVQPTVSGMPGNALSIEYCPGNEKYFQNTNGVISFREYTEDYLLYSSFDVNNDATFAIRNKTAITTGATLTTSGGVFGNYVAIQDGKITYDKCNFATGYKEGTVQLRTRLDFDTAKTYQEFIKKSTSGRNLLSSAQNIDNVLLYSSFNSTIDATFAKGNQIGNSYNSATYGPGGKFGNQLILSGSNIKYLKYDAFDNTSLQTGAISFWLKPNYSGSPSLKQTFVKIWDEIGNDNKIEISHLTNGQIQLIINNESGSPIVNSNLGVFTPAISNLYHIELNFDINTGSTRLFLNGTQLGATQTGTGTRIPAVTAIQLGSENSISNFGIDEFIIYDRVVHNVNFTPSNSELPQTIPYSSVYEFKLKIGGVYINGGNDIAITINPTDTWNTIITSINNAITNSSATLDSSSSRIRITADNIGDNVEIKHPGDGNSLIDLLDGVYPAITPNAPPNDVNIFDFYNGSDNTNRITLIHASTGSILVKMYDGTGTIKVNENLGIWSSKSNIFYELAFCWNDSIAQFYINGTQFGKTIETDFERTGNTDFILSGSPVVGYGYEELIISNIYKYIKNYTIATTASSKFPSSDPCFTLNYGTGIKQLIDVIIDYTGTIGLIPIINNKGYYYSGGTWVQSDMSYSQSVAPNVLKANFATLILDETKPFKIKVFYHSDGTSNVYLNRLFLVMPSESLTKPDYSPMINWIRLKLGAPTVPVELEDSQIEANIYEAVQRYLYYRNSKEDFMTMMITGNSYNGYEIPEGWEDFHDIIFRPNSPISGLVYSGDWGKNIYLQYYYSLVSGGGGFMQGLLTDFYLTMSAMRDAEIILGYQPSYRVLNGRLFLHPDPTTMMSVGLIKKRMPSINEINNDIWIRRYTLALCKITLGEMRETISQIPVGTENIQLNGVALKAEGLAERDKLDEEFRLRMEPLFLEFF